MLVDQDLLQDMRSLSNGELRLLFTYQLTVGGATAIFIRRDIYHHAVTLQGLEHPEATAIQVKMGSKPLIILELCRPTGPYLLQACLAALVTVFPSSWRDT
jgi:hypothetical protein